MLAVVKKIKKYLMMRSYYTTTVYELNRLSNRDLADLGIARSDIEYIAHRAVLKNVSQFS